MGFGQSALEGVALNPSFWRGRKVFLTGHTGFKGGWLSLWLQSLGVELTGFALEAPTDPSLFKVAGVGQGMKSIIGDVRDGESLMRAMRDARPEVVIHMAAQPLVRYSYENPVETYSTNVMGTVHLLEAVRAVGTVRSVVVVTSDKCYENKEWEWGYREDEPMGGYDPYSNSKGCSELVVSSYRSSYFNPLAYEKHGVALATGRAGNVIGGGDWAGDRLIPDILRAVEQGRQVVIRNPHAIRPWQHVLEPLHGYLKLVEKLHEKGADLAQAWNFGPNDEDAKPVGWIVDKLTEQWGEGASWILDGEEHLHEAHFLKLDCSKAKSRLGWHPRWTIEQAIEKIIDWHREYINGCNMREMTLKQIESYV
jgi:CDP-glucose 4,6-dehydratase